MAVALEEAKEVTLDKSRSQACHEYNAWVPALSSVHVRHGQKKSLRRLYVVVKLICSNASHTSPGLLETLPKPFNLWSEFLQLKLE